MIHEEECRKMQILIHGGVSMKGILKAIADIIYTNAINGAGAASVKGTYETQVPESLKKTK